MEHVTPLSFGGVDLSRWLHVQEVARTLAPPVRLEQTEVPGMDGAHVMADGMEAVEVEVSCRMLARSVADVAEARKALASALVSPGAADLVLPDDPTVRYRAVYQGGAELSRLHTAPDVALSFLLPDPVAFGEHRSAGFDKSGAVRVGGTRATWPTFTGTIPSGSTSWQVTRVATGEFVRVAASSSTSSRTVVVDMSEQACEVSGSYVMPDISSDFFSLLGDEELLVTSGSASSLPTTVEWDERWL